MSQNNIYTNPPAVTSGLDPLSTEIGNLGIIGDDGEEYSLPLKDELCYVDHVPFETNTGLSPRNVGPNAANLNVYYLATADIKISEIFAHLDNNGSTTVTVTNTVTGQSVVSDVLNYTAFAPTNIFTLPTPLSVSTGDLVEIVVGAGAIGRWRLVLNGSSPMSLLPTGVPSPTPDAVSGWVRGFSDTPYDVRVYSDGETDKTVYFDTSGDPQEVDLANLPATWVEVPCHVDTIVTGEHVDNTDPLNPIVRTWIKEECYLVGGQSDMVATVRTYDDGQLYTVDKVADTVALLTEIPADWVVCPPESTTATITQTHRARLVYDPVANVNSSAVVLNAFSIAKDNIGITQTANGITGLVGEVRFIAELNFQAAVQRAANSLQLLRNGVVVRTVMASNYIRSVNGVNDNASSVSVFELSDAVATDEWVLQVQREGIVGVVQLLSTDPVLSTLMVDQDSEIDVLVPNTPSTGANTAAPTLPAAGEDLLLFNFQEGDNNAPFNLNFGARGTDGNWEALLVNRPYATIPNVVGAILTTNDNGDGTYDHLLTGVAPATGFDSILITGGLPTPAGDGNDAIVQLFFEAV